MEQWETMSPDWLKASAFIKSFGAYIVVGTRKKHWTCWWVGERRYWTLPWSHSKTLFLLFPSFHDYKGRCTKFDAVVIRNKELNACYSVEILKWSIRICFFVFEFLQIKKATNTIRKIFYPFTGGLILSIVARIRELCSK